MVRWKGNMKSSLHCERVYKNRLSRRLSVEMKWKRQRQQDKFARGVMHLLLRVILTIQFNSNFLFPKNLVQTITCENSTVCRSQAELIPLVDKRLIGPDMTFSMAIENAKATLTLWINWAVADENLLLHILTLNSILPQESGMAPKPEGIHVCGLGANVIARIRLIRVKEMNPKWILLHHRTTGTSRHVHTESYCYKGKRYCSNI